ncbi:Subtilisin-like protease SBT4.9 [Linum grandiflorum]
MGRFNSILHLLSVCIILASNINQLFCDAYNDDRKVYIVYMGALPKHQYSPTDHHLSLIQEVLNDDSGLEEELLVNSYKRSFNGFSAKLTDVEARKLSERNDVVSVFPSTNLQIQTTRSWDFLGLPQPTPTPTLKAGSDVVVGVIDSGIWPESASFDDNGFGPPPAKWKGACKGGTNFTCNNKIIGARCYTYVKSARDIVGHGTHTSSTAAGNAVNGASFYGIASGVARGGLPTARIAVYAACNFLFCPSDAILAAFDDAIADGVDLISISVAFSHVVPLETDPIQIGSFHSANKGILTVQCAGNSGPGAASVVSVAPWLLSVAASTIDRKFETKLMLGNGKIVVVLPLPGVQVDRPSLDVITAYERSTPSPVAKILKSDTVKVGAPVVASFSSRGPNPIIPGILKPDVTAPGVDILAAWPPAVSPNNDFNVISGTSMSCPHVAGIAAYIKSLYPNWSPSAIQSAIMTTATPMHPPRGLHPDLEYVSAEFSYGSGQLNPVNATNPGLVYETLPENYLKLLCNLGYGTRKVRAITGDKTSTCTGRPHRTAINNFNYPSITAALQPKSVASFSVHFTRTVTNVGYARSTYKAQIVGGKELKIEVTPSVLTFASLNEKKSFNVSVSGGKVPSNGFFASASLIWSDGTRNVYIVYMGALPKHQYSLTDHHLSLIQEVLDDDSGLGEELLVNSYKRSFNGFAAKLTDVEAQKLSDREGVVSVFPSKNLQLQTTRSWDFLGLPQPILPTPTAVKGGSDVVIGFIDTGIWPESPSFDDRGFGPPPAKWKGVCNHAHNFTCNNKIIGARKYFYPESARDILGHGTHTASTAAGNVVNDASFYGLANGVARGGFPSARIAVYAVCDVLDCPANDILAAFDDAIADGVDLISISIGFSNAVPLESDPIQIASFHAVAKGILTVHSAGNSGPDTGRVGSVAPWLLSVAASTMDRKFESKVMLGNGKIVVGSSINGFNLSVNELPLIDGIQASSKTCTQESARDCGRDCLDRNLVKGKILVCTSNKGINTALDARAAGLIFLEERPNRGHVLPLPGVQVDRPSLDVITAYLHSTTSPVAKILNSDTVKDTGAPVVADFSSREFSYGSGQLNPVNATNPGLVYETLPADYVKLLCNLGYGNDKVRAITGDKTSICTGQPDPTAINNFNYPSITAALPPKSVASFSVQFTRTVTNVGSAKSTYKAQIVGGKGLKIEVTPLVLTFESLNEKKSFNVSVSGGKVPSNGFFASASLIWSDGTHNVRSPIVIYT